MGTSDGTSTHHEVRRLAAEAGGEVARGVERWPGAVALLAAAGLLAVLLDRLAVAPIWLPPGIAAAAVLLVAGLRLTGRHHLVHGLAVSFPALATVGVAASVVEQIRGVDGAPMLTQDLVLNAALIWASNVLAFALWFWELDGGGPAMRRKDRHTSADVRFPQMDIGPAKPPWYPTFLDYLFFSFNTSTAFSPTDATALSGRAKLLMMAESTVSLAIILVLLARANAGR